IVLVKTPAERVAETLGKPFQPGNPGGPRGARHKATIAAEALLDGEAEGLTRKAIEAALGGDTAALRLCIDGIVPPRRERPINFQIPPLTSAEDDAVAMAAITEAVCREGLVARRGRSGVSFGRAVCADAGSR